MQRTYLTLWKQYLTENGDLPTDPIQKQGLELDQWARKYVKTHKLELQSSTRRKPQDAVVGTYDDPTFQIWSYGEGWKAKFPESLTHQVRITILTDYEQPENNVVEVRVYGAGVRAKTGDMVNSTIKAADWDASKQRTIEDLLKPYVRK